MDRDIEKQLLEFRSRLYALEIMMVGLWGRFLSKEPAPLEEAQATFEHLKQELEKLTSPSVHPAVSDMMASMNQEATLDLMTKVIESLKRRHKSL